MDGYGSLVELTLGHYECRNGRGSQGRADGIALLGCVDPAVPAAPGLSGGKHTTSTTHLEQSQGVLTSTEVLLSTNYLLRLNVRQSTVPAYDSRHSVTGHRVGRKLHHHSKSEDLSLPGHIMYIKKAEKSL